MPLPIDIQDRELHAADQFCINEAYQSDLEGILIPQAEIKDCVVQLAGTIADEYRSNPDFYPMCVLKGAMRFFVDLLRELDLKTSYSEGIIYSSRYQAGPATETPAVQFFQEDSLVGKDVLIIEDILDEGYTLATLRNRIQDFNPASVTVATLFNVAGNQEVDIDPAFKGFMIPDRFFVGYGLDYEERYRNLPHLGVLDPAIVQE